MDDLLRLFDTSGFPPRWHCGTWSDFLGWLHIVSDVAIWLAYMGIPVVLGVLLLRRRDLPVPRILWLFVAFIASCGIGHLVEASMFWWPAYRLSGVVKLGTALVSLTTLVALIPFLSRTLALPAVRDLVATLNQERSERQSAATALKLTQGQLRAAVSASGVGMWGWHPDDDSLQLGENMLRILGLPPGAEVRGFDAVRSCIHPEDRARVDAELQRCLADGGFLQQRFRVVRPDGSIGHVEARTQRDEDGRRLTGACIDVTDQERSRDILQRNTLVLERQNRLLDEFAHLVSHDLKAPLRAIYRVGEWLRGDHGDALGPEGRGHVDVLVERAQQMHGLIQGLLERARTGRDASHDDLFDAHEAVAAVIDILSPPAGIEIRIGPMPLIRYDRLHFERVLQNLIGNAIQHLGRADGRVSVEAHELPDSWRFDVRDDGVGIAEGDQRRIFDMFVSGANGTPAASGVGLAIVHSIVERHGGRVWVESAPGTGSSFSFTVPKAPTTYQP